MVISKDEDMICANINSQDWLLMYLVNVYLNKCTCDMLCKTGYYVKISALYMLLLHRCKCTVTPVIKLIKLSEKISLTLKYNSNR